MRKIVHLTTDHNTARAVTRPLLLIFLITLSLAGCGQQDKPDSAADAGGTDKTGQGSSSEGLQKRQGALPLS